LDCVIFEHPKNEELNIKKQKTADKKDILLIFFPSFKSIKRVLEDMIILSTQPASSSYPQPHEGLG